MENINLYCDQIDRKNFARSRDCDPPCATLGAQLIALRRLVTIQPAVREADFYVIARAMSLTFGNFLTIAVFICVSLTALMATPAGAQTNVHRPDSMVAREFLTAHDAFDRRNIAALGIAHKNFSAAGGARSDFPLAPYISWWWFSAQLAQSAQNVIALGSDIDKFLLEFPDTPFSDQLRRDYLRALGSLNLWPRFVVNQAHYRGDDSEVACQRLRYRLLGDDRAVVPAALADAKRLWDMAKPIAGPCYDVFERVADPLRNSKMLTNNDVWQRTRTLFENGQINDARRSAAFATNISADFDAASARANLDAKRFLEKHTFKANDRAGIELTLFAVTRLARSNAGHAAQWLDKNQSHFNQNDAQYGWAQIGIHGAMQLDINALTWFTRAGSLPLSDAQAGWLVRAALRQTAVDPTQWATVKRAIGGMSAAEKRDSTWRYWLARALAVSTEPEHLSAARSLRETLARENSFYGVLAAEDLGITSTPNFQTSQPTEDRVNNVASRIGIRRAVMLYKLSAYKPDLRLDALREWQFAIRGMDDATLLAAVAVALQNDLPDRAINTAERTQADHDLGQRYPLPHRESLAASAKQNGLDEAWVFGLIRQESRFITDARSRVGAQGLMQLMPATAKWVAKQIGIKNLPASKVVEVPTNLSLGSFYLRHVLDDLGHPVLATAAYNAGPGRARRWRADNVLEGAIYAESIPFNETRDYVKKVMVNKWFYGHRIHGKSPLLSEIMGTVAGKISANSSVAAISTVATNGGSDRPIVGITPTTARIPDAPLTNLSVANLPDVAVKPEQP